VQGNQTQRQGYGNLPECKTQTAPRLKKKLASVGALSSVGNMINIISKETIYG